MLGGFPSCNRMGCNRCGLAWISSQLSVNAVEERIVRAYSRIFGYQTFYVWSWRSGAYGWMYQVSTPLFALFLIYLTHGMRSAVVSHPIELLKSLFRIVLLLHQDTNIHLPVKLQLQTQQSVADRQFKGPIDVARQVLRAQGIQGMWRGLASSVILRSSFFWFFLSVEVCPIFSEARDHI